jgi:hypothetical protein
MNIMIFVVEKKRRLQYLAVCQCGRRHGPYVKVAMIQPDCPDCEQKAVVNERKVSIHAPTAADKAIRRHGGAGAPVPHRDGRR